MLKSISFKLVVYLVGLKEWYKKSFNKVMYLNI